MVLSFCATTLPILPIHLDIVCFSVETVASEAPAPLDTSCSSHVEVFEIRVLDSAIVMCLRNRCYSNLSLLLTLNVEDPSVSIFQKDLGLSLDAVILHPKRQLVAYDPYWLDLSP